MSEQLYSKGQKITSTSNKSNNIVHHNTTVETKLDELDGKIVEVTDAWSNTKSYSVNDYALYNDILYKCILAHSNIVPTNTTYWKPCTIGSEFSQLNNDLSNLFESGSTTVTTGSANVATYTQITFSKSHSKVPSVLISWKNTANPSLDVVSYSVSDIGIDGFKIYAKHKTAPNVTFSFDWLAMF